MKRKSRNSRKDFFTPEQLEAFVAACPPWLAAFAKFGSLTGLRPGEIRRLERNNVIMYADLWHDGQELGLINLRAEQTKSKREE